MNDIIDFIGAALPWVAVGVLLVVFFATKAYEKDKNKSGNYGLIGMLLGMSIGCGLSFVLEYSQGICMTLGMAAGLLVGTFVKKKDDENNDI